jgi:hypothetical protein
MQNDTVDRIDRTERNDRTDLCRMADDGCPHATGDTKPHDLAELWVALGKDDQAAR